AVNAAVSFLLISGYVADLGVRASGIGYATAGNVWGLVALGLALSGAAPVRANLARRGHVSRDSFRRLAHVGLPVGLEEAQFMLAFLVYTRIVARLGKDNAAPHLLARP